MDNFGKQDVKIAREIKRYRGASGRELIRYESGRPFEGMSVTIADLDEETGKPLKVTDYFVEDGKKVPVYEQFIEDLEKLPESEARKTMALPPKARKQERAYTVGMSHAQVKAKLKGFKYFKPFWLGRSTSSGPLKSVIVDKPKKGWSASVYLAYGRNEDFAIEINERDQNSEDGRDDWSVKRGVTRKNILGYPAKVQKGNFIGFVRVIIRANGTLVRIDGTGGQSERELIKIIEEHLEPL